VAWRSEGWVSALALVASVWRAPAFSLLARSHRESVFRGGGHGSRASRVNEQPGRGVYPWISGCFGERGIGFVFGDGSVLCGRVLLFLARYRALSRKNRLSSLWQVAEKHNPSVTPAQAESRKARKDWDSRLRGNDIKDFRDGFFSSLLVSCLRSTMNKMSFERSENLDILHT